VSYGGGHAALLAPVAGELCRRQDWRVSVLGLTTGRRRYEVQGLRVLGFVDFLSADDSHARELGERLTADVDAVSSGVGAQETVAYLGLCMADLIDEVGEAQAWAAYNERGRHAFRPDRTMLRILSTLKPDVVVSTNSPKSERSALEVSARLGIPTVMCPDLFCDPAWEIYKPLKADNYCVISHLAQENLVRHHGALADAVALTGHPAFDKSSVGGQRECRGRVAADLGIEMTGRCYVWATSPDGIDPAHPPLGSSDSIAALRELSASQSLVANRRTILVKPHPSEAAGPYQELLAGIPGVHVVPPGYDSNAVIRASDGVVVCSVSTLIIDSLALGTATVAVGVRRPSLRSALPWEDIGVPFIDEREALRRFWARDDPFEMVPPRQLDLRVELGRLCSGAAVRVADVVARVGGVPKSLESRQAQ